MALDEKLVRASQRRAAKHFEAARRECARIVENREAFEAPGKRPMVYRVSEFSSFV